MNHEPLIEAYKKEFKRTSGYEVKELTYAHGWFTLRTGLGTEKFRKREIMAALFKLERRDTHIRPAGVPDGHKVVHNLLSGQPVIIPIDTPACCDPSTELYHSM